MNEAVQAAAKVIFEQLVLLVGRDVIRGFLDDEAVQAANVAADVAEIAKFGGDK